MAADGAPPPRDSIGEGWRGFGGNCLQEFELYETRSNFYMIGMNEEGGTRRLLKIGRLESSELDLCEDPVAYSPRECRDLLMRIHEGNLSTGGLKFVTNCYGIVGFAKFLGPYYMILITKRRPIGDICGHTIYGISESRIVTISGCAVPLSELDFINESRYKKLLSMVDLSKDFFFSNSFNIMCSLQKNFSDYQTKEVAYETMFVWNEFLSRGIRNSLKNTWWTVALVHGFFLQANIKLKETSKEFKLTLIARRSRHYAGTRFLKRGVNEEGCVANDVETEQIVFEDVPGRYPSQICSVVQYRGSIPLLWSQESSKLNLKPDIILQENHQNYEATRLHFENLVERYGNPIIILNLIKTHEKRLRESKLWIEFANAIESINKELSQEEHLRFLHWDLSKYSKREAIGALEFLGKVAAHVLDSTGFFYCEFSQTQELGNDMHQPINGEICTNNHIIRPHDDDKQCNIDTFSNHDLMNFPMLQRGVLRTNCIDCLDRTNVAQFTYGLASLGQQLHVLGLIDEPKVDLHDPLADELMKFYETMGDTLALQYTGSAAHNKIFSERRGHWKAAIQSQEFLRTLQRYYSNAYMDATKQASINAFLGHYQPPKGNLFWEHSCLQQHHTVKSQENGLNHEYTRKTYMNSEKKVCSRNGRSTEHAREKTSSNFLDSGWLSSSSQLLEEESYKRKTYIDSEKKVCSSNGCLTEYAHERTSSNFLDSGWLLSSSQLLEEESYKRSLVSSLAQESARSKIEDSSADIMADDGKSENMDTCDGIGIISQHFMEWVINGGTFHH